MIDFIAIEGRAWVEAKNVQRRDLLQKTVHPVEQSQGYSESITESQRTLKYNGEKEIWIKTCEIDAEG